MKTIITHSAKLMALSLLIIVNSSFALINKQDSSVCLKINGIILKAPHKAERGSYKVELLNENQVIDSCKVSVNKQFKFSLNKNNWYTLRITKEGHVPLLISFDTKIDDQNALVYEFLFETEVLDAKKVNASNEVMDFPIGIVRYDRINNRFYPIEDYTASMIQKILDPSKPQFLDTDIKDTGKTMMANQDDEDMIVK